LGLLLVPQVAYAALARTEKIARGEYFPPFYLYVDEFQNFATDSFETILSEARKFKLGLTVANQYVSQLSDKIKGAVFGNVGTTVFFRVGPEDATFCTKVFGGEQQSPFKEGDFAYLSKGNCYAKLLVNGQPTKPFYMNIDMKLMVPFKDDPEMAKRIIERSRTEYGKTVEEVNAFIQKRFDEFYRKETPKMPAGGGFDFDNFNFPPLPSKSGKKPLPFTPAGGDGSADDAPNDNQLKLDDNFFDDL